jgi:hypothetical protein
MDTLPAYRRHPAEWLSSGREFQEMQAVDVDAHIPVNVFLRLASGRSRGRQ